jgi:SHS2 domain-containing protein
MEPFRILEHPADIGFEAFGATCQDAFANAARALFHLMVDLNSVELRTGVAVQLEGADRPSLLVNWLSELLYLHDTDGWLFSEFAVERLDDHSLVAEAQGERYDRARHRVRLQVKAITYHQLRLEQTAEGWRAVVYVDI